MASHAAIARSSSYASAIATRLFTFNTRTFPKTQSSILMQLRSSRKSMNIRSESISSASSGSIAVQGESFRVNANAGGGNGSTVEANGIDGSKPVTFKWPDNKRPRVCILGGGFGGLYTALRLESLVWSDDKKPQVILVDQSERFVFKPMLYELLSGEVDMWEIAPLFSQLLANTSVQFFKDRVKFLYPRDHLLTNVPAPTGPGGTVHLESGLAIEYDWYDFEILEHHFFLPVEGVVLQIWIAGQNIILKLANGRTILVLLKIVEEPPLSMRTRSGVSFIINGPSIASVLNLLMNCFNI